MASADTRTPPLPRPRRRARWLVVGGAAATLTGYQAIEAWGRTHLLLINTTASLPNWAFLVDRRRSPRRGSIVFFAAPATPLVRRHFGTRSAPFGKIAYGVAGDLVARRGSDVFVSGRFVARVKPRTSRGEPLVPGPTGVVPPGCLFVATPHPDGFDSRYAEIGWICRDRILGVGEAIL